MSAIFPLSVWQPGTLQPSTPFNDNALRVEILQRGATSILSTPPGSPADGQVHILGATPTGAWSTFAQNDVVLWRSGTWYRFAPFLGWLKQVGTEVRRFDGAAWVVIAGTGGAVSVSDEGTTVLAAASALNFVGSGVSVSDAGGGVAQINVGAGADPWTYLVLGSDFSTTSATPVSVTGLSFTPSPNKVTVVEAYYLLRSSVSTTGPQPVPVFPTAGVTDSAYHLHGGASASVDVWAGGDSNLVTSLSIASVASLTRTYPALLMATLVCGSSVTGSFSAGIQSEIAGSSVTVRAGTWLRYRTIN